MRSCCRYLCVQPASLSASRVSGSAARNSRCVCVDRHRLHTHRPAFMRVRVFELCMMRRGASPNAQPRYILYIFPQTSPRSTMSFTWDRAPRAHQCARPSPQGTRSAHASLASRARCYSTRRHTHGAAPARVCRLAMLRQPCSKIHSDHLSPVLVQWRRVRPTRTAPRRVNVRAVTPAGSPMTQARQNGAAPVRVCVWQAARRAARLVLCVRYYWLSMPMCAYIVPVVECPPHAGPAPHCQCAAGYMGDVAFDAASQTWNGRCVFDGVCCRACHVVAGMSPHHHCANMASAAQRVAGRAMTTQPR
jgi:hypothetical protein